VNATFLRMSSVRNSDMSSSSNFCSSFSSSDNSVRETSSSENNESEWVDIEEDEDDNANYENGAIAIAHLGKGGQINPDRFGKAFVR
jgi:hypothetical protein